MHQKYVTKRRRRPADFRFNSKLFCSFTACEQCRNLELVAYGLMLCNELNISTATSTSLTISISRTIWLWLSWEPFDDWILTKRRPLRSTIWKFKNTWKLSKPTLPTQNQGIRKNNNVSSSMINIRPYTFIFPGLAAQFNPQWSSDIDSLVGVNNFVS